MILKLIKLRKEDSKDVLEDIIRVASIHPVPVRDRIHESPVSLDKFTPRRLIAGQTRPNEPGVTFVFPSGGRHTSPREDRVPSYGGAMNRGSDESFSHIVYLAWARRSLLRQRHTGMVDRHRQMIHTYSTNGNMAMRKILSILAALMILGSPLAVLSIGPVENADAGMTATQMRWYKARARMESSNSRMKGKADYKEREKRGTIEQRLQVRIEKAASNTAYDVFFNDDLIGTVTTNEFGRAELKLRTPEFIRNNRWQPLPPDFPTVVDGDEISVGDASGTFRIRD